MSDMSTASVSTPASMSAADKLKNSKKQRAKPIFSCAECRRMKLKCDRIFPCQNCVKRDRGHLCPDRVLDEDARLRPKDAQRLSDAAKRVEILEKLLRERNIPLPVEEDVPSDELGKVEQEEKDELETHAQLGTLRVDDDGVAAFLGPTAFRMINDADSDDDEPGQERDTFIEDLVNPALAFMTSGALTYQQLAGDLPYTARAAQLTSYFYEYVGWVCPSLTPELFRQWYLPTAYKPLGQEAAGSPALPQKFAVVYIVLSLGSVFDPHFKPTKDLRIPSEAARLFKAGQRCLASSNLSFCPSPSAIFAILLTLHFVMGRGHIQGGRVAYMMIGMGVRIALAMGLHRDGKLWGLSEDETFLRAALWYEIIAHDRMVSIGAGRPYLRIDNDVPDPHVAYLKANKDVALVDRPDGALGFRAAADYQHWQWRVTHEVHTRIFDEVYGVKAATYQNILELDAYIRAVAKDVPEHLRCPGVPTASLCGLGSETPQLQGPGSYVRSMQAVGISLQFNRNLGLLHRNCSVAAMQDYAPEPLRSPWGRSLLIVLLEANRNITSIAQYVLVAFPGIAARWWFVYYHTIGAGLMQAALLLSCPSSTLAPSVAAELRRVVSTIELAAAQGSINAIDLLPRLRRVSERALARYAEQEARTLGVGVNMLNSFGSTLKSTVDIDDAELKEDFDALGAGSALLVRNRRGSRHRRESSFNSGSSASSPPSQQGTDFAYNHGGLAGLATPPGFTDQGVPISSADAFPTVLFGDPVADQIWSRLASLATSPGASPTGAWSQNNMPSATMGTSAPSFPALSAMSQMPATSISAQHPQRADSWWLQGNAAFTSPDGRSNDLVSSTGIPPAAAFLGTAGGAPPSLFNDPDGMSTFALTGQGMLPFSGANPDLSGNVGVGY